MKHRRNWRRREDDRPKLEYMIHRHRKANVLFRRLYKQKIVKDPTFVAGRYRLTMWVRAKVRHRVAKGE